MLRVILVDDERLARQSMRQLLGKHPKVEIVAEAELWCAVCREHYPHQLIEPDGEG